MMYTNENLAMKPIILKTKLPTILVSSSGVGGIVSASHETSLRYALWFSRETKKEYDEIYYKMGDSRLAYMVSSLWFLLL